MDKMKNVVLFLTYRDSSVVIDQYNRLSKTIDKQYETVFVYHQTDNTIPESISKLNPFVFTDDILYGLGYFPVLDSLIPGSNHFPLLKFYVSNPGYDYYWVIEDDVRYTGNWDVFFKAASVFKNDFISTHIKRYHESTDWYWWNTLAHPETEIKHENRIMSFNPVYRISRNALKYIHESLLDKWCGHHEVLFPTLLEYGRFSILDLGGNGSFTIPRYKNFFYTDETMKYRPVLKKAGNIPGKLYHPVKDF